MQSTNHKLDSIGESHGATAEKKRSRPTPPTWARLFAGDPDDDGGWLMVDGLMVDGLMDGLMVEKHG